MKRICILCLAISLVFSSAFMMFDISENTKGKVVAGDELTYITSTPFRINSNAELAAIATSGDGSYGNPWIIENYDINGTGYGYCIYIGNTTDYFVLRNCLLHEASGNMGNMNTGLYLNNVQNGTVYDIVSDSNMFDGIIIESSNHNIFYNITASSNGEYGFDIRSSDHNEFVNNSPNTNVRHGFLFRSSNNNTIRDNTPWNNNMGIYLIESSDNNKIINNNATEAIYIEKSNSNIVDNNTVTNEDSRGVYLDNSNDNIVINNNFSNIFSGITLDSSSNNTITNNWISGNKNGGFLLYSSSDNNIIANNTLTLNTPYGLFINSGGNNLIYHNNFLNNTVQARDTENNLWDNGYPSGGNYWNDYNGADNFSGQNQDILGSDSIGDVNHTIPDANVDNYPLRHPYVWWEEVGPSIELLSPMNNSIIKAGTIIDFDIWDGNLNLNLNIANYSINGETDQSFLIPFDIDTTGWADNPYTIEVHANDTVSNTAEKSYDFTIDSTLPTIILNSPANNSIVQPGTYINFSVSDEHLDFVNYSVNGGSNQTIVTPFNISTIGWQDDDYTIEIHAVDEAGNIAIKSYIFTVDGTPPTVVSMIPVTNSVGIPVNTTLQIFFDEAMNTNSVENSISISPTASILNYDWGINNTTLTITFSSNLTKNTTYTINIDTGTKDVAGNTLTTNFIGSFTTWLDNDNDGIADSDDPDDDNDGVPDEDDPNPFNPNVTGEGNIGDYWWVFVLVGVIIVVIIFFVIKSKPKTPKGGGHPGS